MTKIGIIGGSGLDDPGLLKNFSEVTVETPYGKPSSKLTTGHINNVSVVILARHGKHHEFPPSQVNYRANIWALKQAGCTHILATTAVGSLREHIPPGCIALPNQCIDFTKHRKTTFHEDKVVHTSMSDPFDINLRNLLATGASELKISAVRDVTVITIEGPRFSTRAESHMFRAWGADIINMSTCPEVFLANELKIPYQNIAMSTDYDCWKTDEKPVTFEMVLERMKQNADKVKKLIVHILPRIQ